MITLEVKVMWDFQICMKRKQNYQSHFLNKPPYAERHVGWCERTTKLEIYLTLSPTRLNKFRSNYPITTANPFSTSFSTVLYLTSVFTEPSLYCTVTLWFLSAILIACRGATFSTVLAEGSW
jgi:hypothetical protein